MNGEFNEERKDVDTMTTNPIQCTTKMSFMKKIWREIKRPFQKIGREIKRPFQRAKEHAAALDAKIDDLARRIDCNFNNALQRFDNLEDQTRCIDRKFENIDQRFNNLDDLTDLITVRIQRSISTAILHQKTFSRFKNIHQGQGIVLVATGTTARDYKRIDGAVHIGVNRSFQIENINLHYLFIQDGGHSKSFIKEANQYKPESCTKFYGLSEWAHRHTLAESDAIEANALRYRIDTEHGRYPFRFSHLIDSEPLGAFGSVAFSAIQFALWTNPQTIYLVGCDCSEGYWDDRRPTDSNYRLPRSDATHLIPYWQHLKEFAQLYYPETIILSINPVGLKGLFEEYVQT